MTQTNATAASKQASSAGPTDDQQLIEQEAAKMLQTWDPIELREIAAWHTAYAVAGKTSLRNPNLAPNPKGDDAAVLFMYVSAAVNEVEASFASGARVQLACLRRCLPLEVAQGMIRMVASSGETGWQSEILALFEHSERLAEAIRKQL